MWNDRILHCHVIFAGHIQHKQNASLIGLREGVALESRARGSSQQSAAAARKTKLLAMGM
jgi:hypothetical protein